MTTLLEIANRVEKKNSPDYKKEHEFNWRPFTTVDYVVPDFHINESAAKGAKEKLHQKLSKVLAFVKLIQRMRSKTKCTIIHIPVRNKDNLLIWGSDRNVSNAIKFMKEIGLICSDGDEYRFNAINKLDNSAKRYGYFYENEQKLLQYCSEHGIEAAKVENRIYEGESNKSLNRDINKERVIFSHQLRLTKPDGISKTDFEKELTLRLYENYPGLKYYIQMANEINETYYEDYPEFRVRFQPNFTWNKKGTKITKIGLRATNPMSNMKKEDRKEHLKEIGYKLEKDINASVPRMTLSLNSGHWVEENEDIYALIFRQMEPEGIFTNEIREAIKALHMLAYFDTTDKQVCNHTWRGMPNKEGITKEDVKSNMLALRKAMTKAEGGRLYGSEIYFAESCVYLMTLKYLLSTGHRVWQVYDCFYADGDETQEEFEKLVAENVKLNFNEFYQQWYVKKPVPEPPQKRKRGRPRKNPTESNPITQ